jgi:hypothetical protein
MCISNGDDTSLMEMIHLQWRMTASPERDSSSPAGDAASPSGDLQNSGYVTLLTKIQYEIQGYNLVMIYTTA